MYVRKEALLSAQIEGTQSSLSDLLLFEGEESHSNSIDDVEEVSNYVAAMNYGLERMKSGFPLSKRLVREIHAKLLDGGRGAQMQPGDFPKAVDDAVIGSSEAQRNQMMQLLSDPDKTKNFTRLIYDLIEMGTTRQ